MSNSLRAYALEAEYSGNKIVKAALDIIAGSKLAEQLDKERLANFIKNYSPPELSIGYLEEILAADRALLIQAREACAQCSAPLRSQIKQMVAALKYTRLMVSENPELLKGEIPARFENAKSYASRNVLTALFYIARLSNAQKFQALLPQLRAYYRGIVPEDNLAAKYLKKTQLVFQNIFYTPTIYVKNADQELEIFNSNLKMQFSDCSGFILNIAKALFPDIKYLQKRHNITSKDLAALYDFAANKNNNSNRIYFGPDKTMRLLTAPEQGALEDLLERGPKAIKALEQAFEPVLSFSNLKPGDILIRRHKFGFKDRRAPVGQRGAEGHLLLVLKPDAHRPLCLELTSFHGVGYNVRYETLDTKEQKHTWRILRFKY